MSKPTVQIIEGKYVTTAPNGVVIVSDAPFLVDKWWDNRVLGLVFSYASWATLILSERDIATKPRKIFNKIFAR